MLAAGGLTSGALTTGGIIAGVLTARGVSAAVSPGGRASVAARVPDMVLMPERAIATATLPAALEGVAEAALAGGSTAGGLVLVSTVVFLAAFAAAKAMRAC